MSDADGPVISVVMPVLNAAPFLAAAIESVLAQTFPRFEFLIFDDGSTDRSVEILNEYAARDPRVRLSLHGHRGYVTWLNEGIRSARGEFIARMDADDICLPQRFEIQLRFLREHPEYVAIGSSYVNIDAAGEALLVEHQETDADRFLRRLRAGHLGLIAHPTSMMRREALLRAGGYEKRFETTEDLDLWLRLAGLGRLGNVDELLLLYRHHHANVTYSQAARVRERVGAVLAEHPRVIPTMRMWESPGPTVAERHRLWARWALASGNRKAARTHALLALREGSPRFAVWTVLGASLLPASVVRAALRLAGRRVPTPVRDALSASGTVPSALERRANTRARRP